MQTPVLCWVHGACGLCAGTPIPDVRAVQGQPEQVQHGAAQSNADEANEGNELQREREK